MGSNHRTTITGIAAALLYASGALGALVDAPKWVIALAIVCGAVAHGLNAYAQADAKVEPSAPADPAKPKVPPIITMAVGVSLAFCLTIMSPCRMAPIVVRGVEKGRVCETYSQEISNRLSAAAVSK